MYLALGGERVERAADMPAIAVRLVESAEAEGPFGAKGLGESGVIATSAAVANAIHDATGLRFRELPITSARVHAALEELRGVPASADRVIE